MPVRWHHLASMLRHMASRVRHMVPGGTEMPFIGHVMPHGLHVASPALQVFASCTNCCGDFTLQTGKQKMNKLGLTPASPARLMRLISLHLCWFAWAVHSCVGCEKKSKTTLRAIGEVGLRERWGCLHEILCTVGAPGEKALAPCG